MDHCTVPRYRRPLALGPSGHRSLARLITSFSLPAFSHLRVYLAAQAHSLPRHGQKFSHSHIRVITTMSPHATLLLCRLPLT